MLNCDCKYRRFDASVGCQASGINKYTAVRLNVCIDNGDSTSFLIDDQYGNFYDTEHCQGLPSREDYTSYICGCFSSSTIGNVYTYTRIPGSSKSTELLSTGAIIGIAVGGFAGVVLIGVAVYYFVIQSAISGANKAVEMPKTSV